MMIGHVLISNQIVTEHRDVCTCTEATVEGAVLPRPPIIWRRTHSASVLRTRARFIFTYCKRKTKENVRGYL